MNKEIFNLSEFYKKAGDSLKWKPFEERVEFITDKIYKEDKESTGELSKEYIKNAVVRMLYIFNCCNEFECNVLRTILNIYRIYGKWQ